MTRRRPPPEPTLRTCRNGNCGAEFRPDRPSQLFCTAKCRNAAKARQRRSHRLAEIDRLRACVDELQAQLATLEGKPHREASSNGSSKADA